MGLGYTAIVWILSLSSAVFTYVVMLVLQKKGREDAAKNWRIALWLELAIVLILGILSFGMRG
ncbi:MAG: hypothetical protein JW772_01950 [Candidatus Diapherotrites archaeon]|nr:hypothetical protein [Candidatus Diapherotrites archaeon]